MTARLPQKGGQSAALFDGKRIESKRQIEWMSVKYQWVEHADAWDLYLSQQALIGTKIPLHISQFTDDNFADMKRMKDNRANGRPITEGVKSGLSMTVDSGHPLSKLT